MSAAASDAPRLIAVVVFPTPPFWLAMAMTFPMELTLQDFGVWFHVEQSRVVGYFERRGYSPPWQSLAKEGNTHQIIANWTLNSKVTHYPIQKVHHFVPRGTQLTSPGGQNWSRSN